MVEYGKDGKVNGRGVNLSWQGTFTVRESGALDSTLLPTGKQSTGGRLRESDFSKKQSLINLKEPGMSEQSLTYSRLDEALRSVGFTPRTLERRARIYKHPSGATVILPDAPFKDTVIPHHLVVVRTVLAEYNLPDPLILASEAAAGGLRDQPAAYRCGVLPCTCCIGCRRSNSRACSSRIRRTSRIASGW